MASSINASTSGGGGVIVTSDATGNLDIQSGGSTVVAVTSAGVAVTGSLNTPNTFGFKNRIINGGMVIDQRNAGAASANTINAYFLDRWAVFQSTSGKVIAQQNAGSVTSPAGFTNYLGVTSQSAFSVASSDYYIASQGIEGFNFADLAWGTASAATVTLSFWIRSSLTGTFGGSLRNGAGNYSYPFTYTISAANTWEQKTVTVAGPTAGTWIGATNALAMQVNFGLGVGATFSGTAGAWAAANYLSATGAVSVVGTSGATFYITGVQLEKGSTATSFDYRPYGTELALCQRYLPAFLGNTNSIVGQAYSGTAALISMPFVVTPRVSPTGITTSAISSNNFILTNTSSSAVNVTGIVLTQASTSNMLITPTTASGLSAGSATVFVINTASGYILGTGCEL